MTLFSNYQIGEYITQRECILDFLYCLQVNQNLTYLNINCTRGQTVCFTYDNISASCMAGLSCGHV